MPELCPKCAAPKVASPNPMATCHNCGIVFAKYDPAKAAEMAERLEKLRNRHKVPPPEPAATKPVQESLSLNARYDAAEKRLTDRTGLGYGAWMLVLLVIGTIVWVFTSQERKSTASEPSAMMAYVQCQAYVKRRLLAPASADFPWSPPSAIDEGGGTYLVTAYVDSQNGFGAMLRKNWMCKAKYVGGQAASPSSWRLIDLTM